jgi:ATPases of the AAA+ class
MKDDIGDILDSMFKGGKFQFGETEESRQEAGNTIENVQSKVLENAEMLQSRIARLTQETQREMERMEKQQINTSVSEVAVPEKKEEFSLSKTLFENFEEAEKNVKEQVLGQDKFVSDIALMFKRPLIVGMQEGMPSTRSLIIGRKGTGKHKTLEMFSSELNQKGILKSGKIAYIDLSSYLGTADEKRFIQDLYAAVSGEAQVLVFENFEMCHNSVLSIVSNLYLEGKAALPGRYIEQKGNLVDIGTALVKNAVSSIDAKGKYLFIMTDKSEKKLMDAFGAKFLSACEDISYTAEFERETLIQISERLLKKFCENAKKKLGLQLKAEKAEAETLSAKFIPDSGISSLKSYIEKLWKILAEYKLKIGTAYESGIITSNAGELEIVFPKEVLVIDNHLEEEGTALAEIKEELKEIIGLGTVKEYVYALEDNFKVQQMRRQRGMKAEFPSMHMIFTGNPGTGKTTIARIVSRYLKAIGVLSDGQLIEVTRADLVGKYVGHTAPLTQKAIQSALGGVLFVDEAYALYRGKDDSFGLEAIDTLVKGIEDNRENLLVILAGYTMEMEEFLTSNSGLKSRFPNMIEFPDYTAQELVDITKSIIKSKGYLLEEGCEEALYVHYDIMQTTGDPRTNGNGRMARNKVEEAILNCSKRNISAKEEDINLELLKKEDFQLGEKVAPAEIQDLGEQE